MKYTEQQLADLYTAAVAAEASFNNNGESGSEGFDLEILMEKLGGREKIIRTLIDNLRECCRRAPAETAFPVAFPKELHPETRKLVINTAHALAVKLNKAQEKRPNAPIGWKLHPWRDECRALLLAHIEKGDPLDVMAYAAFMHYHGWSTAKPAPEITPELTASTVASLEDDNDPITVPRGLLGAALGAISHPAHPASATVAALKHYAHNQPKQTGINTGLSWEDYKGISDRAPVHEALQGFTEDATEDNAISLIRAIAEALRPRPRFWLDMHGYSCYLRSSEAEAVSHCNETGGLYVLPLFAGEPINAKLPMRMCRPADEPQTIEVSALLRNLQSIPQRYSATDYVSLAEVFAVIEALKGKL